MVRTQILTTYEVFTIKIEKLYKTYKTEKPIHSMYLLPGYGGRILFVGIEDTNVVQCRIRRQHFSV